MPSRELSLKNLASCDAFHGRIYFSQETPKTPKEGKKEYEYILYVQFYHILLLGYDVYK